MRVTVRATRGYLAGFGTTGSLLAGAAVLFTLGSAIVAFRGWPQIATGPATTAVAAAHPALASHVARRLAAVLAKRQATGGASVGPLARGRPRAAVRGVTVVRGTGAPGSLGGASSGVSGSAGGASATGCAHSGCNQPGSQSPISRLTSAVAQEVSGIGSSAGSQASSGSSAVAGNLSGTSPQAASAVQSGGSSSGSAVSGSATTAGSAVSQTGNAVGGGH